MSIAKKALVVATLSIACGAGVAGMPAANAATAACGPGCIEVFSPRFGDANNPGAVETVLGGVARVGAPIGLGPASGTNTAADMMPHFGSVSQFYAAGMVSAAVNQPTMQFQFSMTETPNEIGDAPYVWFFLGCGDEPESGVVKGKFANGVVTAAIPNPRTQLKPFARQPNNRCDLEFRASDSKMADSNTLKTTVDFK